MGTPKRYSRSSGRKGVWDLVLGLGEARGFICRQAAYQKCPKALRQGSRIVDPPLAPFFGPLFGVLGSRLVLGLEAGKGHIETTCT